MQPASFSHVVRAAGLLLFALAFTPLQAAPDGARLYGQNCAACHGQAGQGGVGVPLALPAFLATVTDEYLATTIREGRPGRVMPAFRHLSDAQLDALVAHLRAFAPDARPVVMAERVTGDARRGGELYQQHCAACHGASGEGGKGTGVTFSRPRDLPIIAPALNNPGYLAAASDSMIKTTLLHGRAGTPMQSFLKFGLSEADISDVVAYVRSFHSTTVTAPAPLAAQESAVLVVDSPYSLERTVANVKSAAVAANYRIIRVQPFDQGLVEAQQETTKEVMVYFCNFPVLNDVLAMDPRVGLFLPCRVTVVERDGAVQVMAINPKYLSRLFNNAELDKACDDMYAVYQTILEESTL